jgi:hypothetical protein
MSDFALHSLVLASDYRVPDTERMWSLLKDSGSALADIGAHHVVVYASTKESGRILVTIGIRQRLPLKDILRSPAMFEWFDIAGIEDIPAIFAGEVVEKIDLDDPTPDDRAPGVIVAAMASVDDVPALVAQVHSGLERFKRAGIRKVWVYQAFDDGQEVMILQEVDNENNAQQWIDHPDAAAKWMSGAGLGAYPPLFVGTLKHVMTVEAGG